MTEEDIAVEAANAAAAILSNDRPAHAQRKGAVDWVTDVDLRCEDAVRAVLARHSPRHPRPRRGAGRR